MTKLGYSKGAAASLVGVSEQTIARAVNRGELGAKRIGTRIVIPEKELLEWFDALPGALDDDED